MKQPTAYLTDVSAAGQWKVVVRPKRGVQQNIAMLRDVPLLPDSMSFADPYGPADMTLALPQVSMYDRLGQGDLDWLQNKISIDVIWTGPLPPNYPFSTLVGPSPRRDFRWEGYTSSFTLEEGTLQLSSKGAMLQLDDYLAKPEYLHRPLPYEHAIRRQFHDKAHLRLTPLHIHWPTWWDLKFTPVKGAPSYMVPRGVHKGDNWTGLVTRSTGSWDPVLSSYIASLLNAMYTRHGRWSLDLLPGRRPVLLHRPMLTEPDAGTAVLDLVSSAYEIQQLEIDWTQALDVIYGAGQSLAGNSYSGMQITNDGERTFYLPLAYSRRAYPDTRDNRWRDLTEMPKETMLQTLTGLDEYQASRVAQAHLERFGDPGITGSAELSGDVPLHGGGVVPHHLVRAGMSVQLKNLLGMRNGPVAHISSSSTSLTGGKTQITFDTKYREALTVDEVRIRGRDSLNISRMLIGGQYAPPVPDELLPWDYAAGAGQIPYDPMTRKFFETMPDDELFPWTNWTRKHPPYIEDSHRPGHFKPSRWYDAYIEIGPASRNANNNWSGRPKAGAKTKKMLYAIPVKASQAGTIRLIEIAAYDKHGNVMRVPFHVSFYYNSMVTYQNMPEIPSYDNRKLITNTSPPPAQVGNPGYYPYKHKPYNKLVDRHVAQHYPYVKGAFEEYNLDGTRPGTEIPRAVRTAGLWKAWGNDAVKAGYFPRDGFTGKPTGLFREETPQSFDLTTQKGFNVYIPKGNSAMQDVGYLYVMIYCDAQGPKPVFFLGRMYRQEPGSQGNAG